MKSCGIIVEYNPFHNGHRYHVEMARKTTGAEVVIAVMSGNFLQRGEPAIIDKWHRANEALQNGVDLVVELPVEWAVQSADYFAKGAVKSCKHWTVTVCVLEQKKRLRLITAVSDALSKRIKIG